jgi:TetR/AcrR family transcriptional regulator, regulator of cefoperazone and chloramphenicol sensitivity
MPAATVDKPRPARSESEAARARLLHAGLRLFAQQGFAKTSTRELAEAAKVNIAAISYYFGDKAGLYRAVFFEPHGVPVHDVAQFSAPALSLAQALRVFYAGFVEPLRHGDAPRLCMKLHMREMLEPTGMWEEEISRGIQPAHVALVKLLGRHLGVARTDDDLHRLAICVAGLGVHLHVGHDVIDVLAPRLNAGPNAVDTWTERLAMYAQAMLEAEGQRRQAAARKEKKT